MPYERLLEPDFSMTSNCDEQFKSVLHHRGDSKSVLRRLKFSAQLALDNEKAGLDGIRPYLMDWMASDKVMQCAWDDLARRHSAPGPNGRRFEDYDEDQSRDLIRTQSIIIKGGEYQPGPVRLRPISKGSGRGTRTITMQNIEDKMVSKAALLVLSPLYDPTFDDHSFGFRPRRGRQHALRALLDLAKRENLWHWAVDDVQNAFDVVPTGRLLQVLRKRLPNEAVRFVQLAGTIEKKGIRQGSPLSPFLLNVYLDHFLDKPWRRDFPRWPLLRTADDLIVLCETRHDAQTAHAELKRRLIAAGTPLKGGSAAGVFDMAAGDTVDWLGYRLQKRNDAEAIAIRIAERSWDRLAMKLALAHLKTCAPLRANEAIKGWFSELGPQYEWERRTAVLDQVKTMAAEFAFDEIPCRLTLLSSWHRGAKRWRSVPTYAEATATNK